MSAKSTIFDARPAGAIVSAVGRQSLRTRLDELRLLKDGWFEGGGSAPSSAGIDWLSDELTRAYPEDLPLPVVYPNPEGGIRLEWSLGPRDVTLDIDLANHVAGLHALNLDSAEELEEGLNLDEPAEWARLIEMIQRVAAGEARGWLHQAEPGA